MSTPRISPGGLRELGLPIWAFTRLAGRATRTGPPRIFTTLGHNRGLFWGWLHFAGRLMPGGKLPRIDTELVILRVAAVPRQRLRVRAPHPAGAPGRARRRRHPAGAPGPRTLPAGTTASPCSCA